MARVVSLESPTFQVPDAETLRKAIDALAGKGACTIRMTNARFIIQAPEAVKAPRRRK